MYKRVKAARTARAVRAANPYLQYRKYTIDRNNKRKMTDHSKITAPEWGNMNDSDKRIFIQATAKEALEKEAAFGGNNRTTKSYEQCGNYGFVIECLVNPNKEEIMFEKYTQNTDYHE
ncbi:hypothetical protein RclHR1_00220038 [Rhizophagus clarus]|uniref:Uncharacterized protein n=1 Tax=Rhizophagus clarus TaxID=94130 RepID=A0A2Z6R745_9GLOM|nr:hypothetical protein RclHR1_00220038 [Rhizophagus clarus]GES84581.1 hypothetical protein GLOIN_2v1485034 [Rhizophagus clarus]